MTLRITGTGIHTVPPSSEMAVGQVKEIVYDATLDLGEGQAPTNAAVTLVERDRGTAVEDGAELDTPPIAGNRIALRVANLARGTIYELRIAFDHDPPRVAGERTVRLHVIECVA